MNDLKVLNLEKYVGSRVTTYEVHNALVVGYVKNGVSLLIVEREGGWREPDINDVILLDGREEEFWYVTLAEIKRITLKPTLRDMVGLDVMYQGKPRRCVGYNEGLNAAILQKNGGWVKFSKGDVIGVREDLDAGFEYADYNEVEVL
jgi:hypothetical protein